jgi:SAM-dependent methyltransferase
VAAARQVDSPYLDPAVAAAFDGLAAPAQFTAPARDLAALLDPGLGAAVLDVGTGTGVVARELAAAVGPSGIVVGIDPSIEMLRAARARSRLPAVVAGVPGLPFAATVFDRVAASFVITHVDSYADALADMVRVCRPQGRIGLSAWGSLPNPAGTLWRETAARVVSVDRLGIAFRAVIPWDEWFAQAGRLESALRDAGLIDVVTDTREYVIRVPTDNFLSMKHATVEGTLLKRLLTDDEWRRFSDDAAAAFRTRFGAIVEYTRDVWFAVGTKRQARGV